MTELELIELAEEILDKRLEKGGLAEIIDELTSTQSDMAEFEANLWAYLRENRLALRYVANKYANKFEDELRQELGYREQAEDEDRKFNREGW